MEKSTLSTSKEDVQYGGHQRQGPNTMSSKLRLCGYRVPSQIFFPFVAFCFMLWLARPYYTRVSFPKLYPTNSDQTPQLSVTTWEPRIEADKALVPLEAHIMSKCPDAKVCLEELVLPAMQRVYDKVNFTLSYIGTPTENDGVACMHGAPECMGNIIELCAAKHYPDPKTYLGFTMCLTRDYKYIPQRSLVEDCSLEHGIDFQILNSCVSDDDGVGLELLRSSVRRSIEAGVTKSCTVRLDNEIYCIHDGTWKDCPHGPGVSDLVIAVQKLYGS